MDVLQQTLSNCAASTADPDLYRMQMPEKTPFLMCAAHFYDNNPYIESGTTSYHIYRKYSDTWTA